jgi:hypothetical protein
VKDADSNPTHFLFGFGANFVDDEVRGRISLRWDSSSTRYLPQHRENEGLRSVGCAKPPAGPRGNEREEVGLDQLQQKSEFLAQSQYKV